MYKSPLGLHISESFNSVLFVILNYPFIAYSPFIDKNFTTIIFNYICHFYINYIENWFILIVFTLQFSCKNRFTRSYWLELFADLLIIRIWFAMEVINCFQTVWLSMTIKPIFVILKCHITLLTTHNANLHAHKLFYKREFCILS